jgi:predicted secreted protein
MNKIQSLQRSLKDSRSGKVIFLSHCILNENTRYLGGACRAACIREIVEQCLDKDIGIVQMPCPEQIAWGGVTKRLMLLAYGAKGTFFYRTLSLFFPLFLMYTRVIFRRLARETAGQIRDYLTSGFSVIGVMGIDGSPSCGINKTLDMRRSFESAACINVESVTVERMNSIISGCLIEGRGIFIDMLQEELGKRLIHVPFTAHDLIAEIQGIQSSAVIPLS